MRLTNLLASATILASIAVSASAADFQLQSQSIAEGEQLSSEFVFQGFGCEGGNLSPQLSWVNAPQGTKSFAITAYDPDAPTGSGWWHWFAFNIPADVRTVKGGDVTGVQLTNDYGAQGFGGACPPPGEVHRYEFTVHALGSTLGIDESVSNALAGFMVNANSLASSTITAVYTR